MALIKTAAQIMAGHAKPPGWQAGLRSRPGRPRLDRRCELPDCDRKHHSKGLCERHRDNQVKWGNPYHVFQRGRFGRCVCPEHPGGVVRGSHQNG